MHPSKGALAVAMLDLDRQRTRARLVRAGVRQRARHACHPLERFDQYAALLVAYKRRVRDREGAMLGCGFGNFAAELATRDPKIQAKLADIFAEMRAYFEAAISDAVLSGDIGPTAAAQASVACWPAWRAWYCGGQGGERPRPDRPVRSACPGIARCAGWPGRRTPRRGREPVTDRQTKALTADLDLPSFETTAFTVPPPLDACTVALVTTASLHHPEQADFTATDPSFRVLDPARRDLQLGHWSPNFDLVGFAVDLNVVFPIDRLEELARAGRIGGVAPRHLAFAGNQFDLTQIRLDSAPAAAKLLRDDGVDVVVLTPV